MACFFNFVLVFCIFSGMAGADLFSEFMPWLDGIDFSQCYINAVNSFNVIADKCRKPGQGKKGESKALEVKSSGFDLHLEFYSWICINNKIMALGSDERLRQYYEQCSSKLFSQKTGDLETDFMRTADCTIRVVMELCEVPEE